MTNTPALETQTATIHTIRLGTRQLTIGVYRQLDHFPADQVEPFGRVKDSQDPHSSRVCRFVGRHKTTGELVQSHAWIPGTYSTADESERIAERELYAAAKALPLIILGGAR